MGVTEQQYMEEVIMHYVMVGNSYAAFGAIEAIRALDKNAAITVISEEEYPSYARPLITFWLGGSVNTENMYYRDLDYYKRNNITALLGVKAESIDVATKVVVLGTGQRVPYDKLLLATGGTPFIPPMEGLSPNVRNIHTFTKWDDAKALRQLSQTHRKAVVVGGGLIGLKASEGLNDAGVDTTIVELGPRVLSLALDEVSGNMAETRLNANGIKTITSTTVEQVTVGADNEVTGVVLKDGRTLSCDILVIAVGVRPNIELAKTAGIVTDRGIVTSKTMQTSVRDIYAAGDVAQNMNILSGKEEVVAIVPVAYEQGRVAGRNMAGYCTEYPGAIAMNSVEIYGLPIMSMGITRAESGSHHEIVSCDSEVYKKYVFEGDRLVGALLVGDVKYAGILTNLIRSRRSLSHNMMDRIVSGDLHALVA